MYDIHDIAVVSWQRQYMYIYTMIYHGVLVHVRSSSMVGAYIEIMQSMACIFKPAECCLPDNAGRQYADLQVDLCIRCTLSRSWYMCSRHAVYIDRGLGLGVGHALLHS